MARAVVVMLVMSATAGAQPGADVSPIVLVASDVAFAAALDDALVPAGMDVIAVSGVGPPSSAELTSRSRELADRQRAIATVWLLAAPDGATLVAYDRAVDRLLVRDLPYRTPLSAIQAAEAARMVRTMLRALRVTHDEEPAPPAGPTTLPELLPIVAAHVGVGAWFLAPGNDQALAATATVVWRPHALGAALTLQLAPPADITEMTFSGEVRDTVIAAEVRRAVVVAPDVRVAPAAGLALHLLELSGSFGGPPLVSRRYDPAVRLGATAVYALPHRVEVGLALSADFLLRRQRYEAASEQILIVPRVQLAASLIVGFWL